MLGASPGLRASRFHGLQRLRCILDPTSIMGEDDPSETFRLLKNNQIRELGEHRPLRLVLEAWNRLEQGELT